MERMQYEIEATESGDVRIRIWIWGELVQDDVIPAAEWGGVGEE